MNKEYEVGDWVKINSDHFLFNMIGKIIEIIDPDYYYVLFSNSKFLVNKKDFKLAIDHLKLKKWIGK